MSRSRIRRARRPAGRRPPSGRSRKGGGNALWIAVIIFALILAGGAVFLSERLKKQGVMDSTTLCPTNGPTAALAILLDLTDPVTAPQAQRLRMILGREIARAQAGTMISVGLVSEDSDKWGADFARCKPQQESDANPLIQNPRMVGERYNDEFIVPLDRSLSSLIHVEAEDSSPIMESLQALVADTPSIEVEPIPRKFVLVSDLLQNSETLSFYRGEYWDAFVAAGGQARLSGNLQGVEVMIVRIPRQVRLAGEPKVDHFWLNYFDIQGTRGNFDVRILGDL